MKNPTLLYWIIGAAVLLAIAYFFFFKEKQGNGENDELSFLNPAGKKEFWNCVKWLKAQPDDAGWKKDIVEKAARTGNSVDKEIYLSVLWVMKNKRGLI